METLVPRDGASLDPRGLIGSIYVEDHLALLHTKYIIYGLHGFREEFFLHFSHYRSNRELYVAMATGVPIQSVQKP